MLSSLKQYAKAAAAIKLKRHSPIPQLREAKRESDRKNYPAKHAILRALIQADPGSFSVDSNSNGILGLTHKSGFRLHIPRSAMPTAPVAWTVPDPMLQAMKLAISHDLVRQTFMKTPAAKLTPQRVSRFETNYRRWAGVPEPAAMVGEYERAINYKLPPAAAGTFGNANAHGRAVTKLLQHEPAPLKPAVWSGKAPAAETSPLLAGDNASAAMSADTVTGLHKLYGGPKPDFVVRTERPELSRASFDMFGKPFDDAVPAELSRAMQPFRRPAVLATDNAHILGHELGHVASQDTLQRGLARLAKMEARTGGTSAGLYTVAPQLASMSHRLIPLTERLANRNLVRVVRQHGPEFNQLTGASVTPQSIQAAIAAQMEPYKFVTGNAVSNAGRFGERPQAVTPYYSKQTPVSEAELKFHSKPDRDFRRRLQALQMPAQEREAYLAGLPAAIQQQIMKSAAPRLIKDRPLTVKLAVPAQIAELARGAGVDPAGVAVSPTMPLVGPGYVPANQFPTEGAMIRGKMWKAPASAKDILMLDQTTSPAVIAHELGHARIRKHVGKAQQLARLLGNLGIIGGTVGGGFGSKRLAIAGTVAQAPMLADELGASHIGGRSMLRRHEQPEGFWAKTRSYLSPFQGIPSYLLAAAGPTIGYKAHKHYFPTRK